MSQHWERDGCYFTMSGLGRGNRVLVNDGAAVTGEVVLEQVGGDWVQVPDTSGPRHRWETYREMHGP